MSSNWFFNEDAYESDELVAAIRSRLEREDCKRERIAALASDYVGDVVSVERFLELELAAA